VIVRRKERRRRCMAGQSWFADVEEKEKRSKS
jgi:hypothetical protein